HAEGEAKAPRRRGRGEKAEDEKEGRQEAGGKVQARSQSKGQGKEKVTSSLQKRILLRRRAGVCSVHQYLCDDSVAESRYKVSELGTRLWLTRKQADLPGTAAT